MSAIQVHHSIFSGLADLSIAFGDSPRDLFQRFELDVTNLGTINQYLPIEKYESMVSYCAARFKQPNFNELLAKFQFRDIFSSNLAPTSVSTTLQQHLKRIAEQSSYLLKGVKFKAQVCERRGSIEVLSEGDALPVSAQIHALTLIDRLVSQLSSRSQSIRSWVLSEPSEQTFERSVIVEEGRTALQFDPRLLSGASAPTAKGLSSRQLDEVITELKRQLEDGKTSLESVAASFAISGRQLQRQLKDYGTSFRQLLDATRFQYARSYLDQNSLSLSYIAGKLGYSEDSAFSRSFKRWTGHTPQDFRLNPKIV